MKLSNGYKIKKVNLVGFPTIIQGYHFNNFISTKSASNCSIEEAIKYVLDELNQHYLSNQLNSAYRQ